MLKPAGGWYDARTYILNHAINVDDESIERLQREVESGTHEWVLVETNSGGRLDGGGIGWPNTITGIYFGSKQEALTAASLVEAAY